jgi:two-component system, chemotaxis family, sensor kinase CheA
MSDDALIQEFLDESLESLTSLDEKIDALLHSQDLTADVNLIFRPVHSIKGAASFFKLEGLTSMAHKLETVLDQLRQMTMEVSEEVISQLNRGFYLLRSLVERGLGGDHGKSAEDEEFLSELDDLLAGKGGDPAVALGKLIEELKAENLKIEEFEEKVKSLFGLDAEVEDGLPQSVQEILDLLQHHIETQDANDLPKIKDKYTALMEDADEEALKHLKSFEEDFIALSESPVGIDEMMGEVLIDHLKLAGSHLEDVTNEEPEPEADSGQKEEASVATPSSSAGGASPAKDSKSIRVNVQLLEDIMNLTSELVLKRNELNVHAGKLGNPLVTKTTQEFSTVMTDLQGKVMKTRLQPVATVFNPLPGVVREISRKLGKEVSLVLEGKTTELDRSVLEGIKDPLTHILRNSLDHGFEMPEEREAAGKSRAGRLLVKAYHEGGQVVIEIRDDGRGVNVEKVSQLAINKGILAEAQLASMTENQQAELIFAAGFSTAEKVSEVSGRGVGMDVVRSNIVALGGTVELDSKWGKGTCLKMKIPLTLAIVPALIVGDGVQRFAISQANLEAMVLLKREDLGLIENVRGVEVFHLRGEILPLVRLSRVLEKEDKKLGGEDVNVIVLKAGLKQYALMVDQLFDIEEIVVKSIDDVLPPHPFISGATILGDGAIALIIDSILVANMVGLDLNQGEAEVSEETHLSIQENRQVLLFQGENGDSYGIPMENVERLEHIKAESIDVMNRSWFLRYRGGVLPLVSSWKVIGSAEPSPLPPEVHVIVFRVGSEELGIAVDQIQDVVSMEGAMIGDLHTAPHILGSAILRDRIVTVLNLAMIANGLWEVGEGKEKERVLMWEQTPEMAEKASDLRDMGYDVTEVHSKEEMEEVVRNVDIDVILTESSMDSEEEASLQEMLKDKYGKEKRVSVVSLDDEDSLWKSELESDELSDVIDDILQSKLKD